MIIVQLRTGSGHMSGPDEAAARARPRDPPSGQAPPRSQSRVVNRRLGRTLWLLPVPQPRIDPQLAARCDGRRESRMERGATGGRRHRVLGAVQEQHRPLDAGRPGAGARHCAAHPGGEARADFTAGFDANLLWQPGKSWLVGLTNRFEWFVTNSEFKSAGGFRLTTKKDSKSESRSKMRKGEDSYRAVPSLEEHDCDEDSDQQRRQSLVRDTSEHI